MELGSIVNLRSLIWPLRARLDLIARDGVPLDTEIAESLYRHINVALHERREHGSLPRSL
jgi:hypothetical protein